MKEGKTEFMARVQDQVIVIKDVPSWACKRCGEAWFSYETSEKIDNVMQEVHPGTICVRPLAAGEIDLPA
jgi:YgiT-type zinc finger domain-containing protein